MIIIICLMVEADSSGRRLPWIPPLAMLGYGLYRTASRGAFVMLLAALIPALIVRFGRKKALMVGLAVIPAILLIFSGRITAISASEGTGQGRIQFWYAGLQLFLKAPIFGIGMDWYIEETHSALHNSFLQYFVELGLVGGILFMGAYLVIIRELSRMGAAGSVMKDADMRRLRSIVFALLAGYGVGLLTCNKAYTEITYALIGVGAAYVSIAAQRCSWMPVHWDRAFVKWMARVGVFSLAIIYLFVRFNVR
jgi:O-antigen ligase